MTISAICIVGLATFTITYMIRHLAGPLDVFEIFRKTVGIIRVPVLDGAGNVTGYVEEVLTPDRFITKLVNCYWCLGTWIAMAMTILYCTMDKLGLLEGLFIWLGATGISGIIYTIVEVIDG